MAGTGEGSGTPSAIAGIIDGAYAILEPPLADLDAEDALLARYINAASDRVMSFLNWQMTEADIAALPEVIRVACVRLVIILYEGSQDGKGAEYQRESLGDYSYDTGRLRAPGSLPLSVITLLTPYVRRNAPTVL